MITGTLEAIYSERDRNGNVYWAMRYTDSATGKAAFGTVTGGESNIYAILCDLWGNPHGWDRSVTWRVTPMKIRAFNKLTRDWAHAGCLPAELAAFIQAELDKPDGPSPSVDQEGFIRDIPVRVVGLNLGEPLRDQLICRVTSDCALTADTKIICAINEFSTKG